jgi:16S rRNA (cytidine1402-2'-O)-methyltransferase
MSGTLFVVATPIGNLEDITLRALRVLREVDLIAAEDTRRTAKLLTHHGISTRTVSFHAHNTKRRLPELLAQLRSERSIAIVSDAGTPGISDPGEELVRACVLEGIPVEPVPGVSAAITAVVVSGFAVLPLTVFGFPPRRPKDRTQWISAISGVSNTVTFFESPRRIGNTLREASLIMGTRQIMVARELTKVHQEFLRGTCAELAERLAITKGEITVVISPIIEHVTGSGEVDEQRVATEFWSMTIDGVSGRRQAISTLAKKFDIPSKQVYAIIEKSKRSGD